MNITKDNATFRYRDEQTKHWKQRTRDYGFLRGNTKGLLYQIQCLLLPLLQQLLGIEPLSQPTRTCPCCQHSMRCIGILRPR
ncbi:hypothetical protein Q4519_21645 [Motilimonas sp. 1_MG-2023]|uniref:hypothetical protein n=1 Tax=Motilimonas sp. 1_MG-2023 TaxID=3062672 RepID=UPI0026E3A400|nr:hypothetical protein [Motilimonas sp. 1_MG-2023]MDO6528261.1 hypothetical protein [Motilimonas sp. 1_MG-2023]